MRSWASNAPKSAATEESRLVIRAGEGPADGKLVAGDAVLRLTLTTAKETITRDVTLTKASTADNQAIGNDTQHLLDADEVPTFDTAQELAARLAQTLGLPANLRYDAQQDVLYYDVHFEPGSLQPVEAPVDVGLDLAGLASPGGLAATSLRLTAEGSDPAVTELGFATDQYDEDSVGHHFFIVESTLAGSGAMRIDDLDAQARFGFLGVEFADLLPHLVDFSRRSGADDHRPGRHPQHDRLVRSRSERPAVAGRSVE